MTVTVICFVYHNCCDINQCYKHFARAEALVKVGHYLDRCQLRLSDPDFTMDVEAASGSHGVGDGQIVEPPPPPPANGSVRVPSADDLMKTKCQVKKCERMVLRTPGKFPGLK